MPTRWAPCSASASIVEAMGGRATAVCTDPIPPLYGFMPGIDRFRTDPDPAEAYDLLVLADCASAERVGEVAQPQRRAVRGAAAGDHRPPRLERHGGRRRLDRPRRRRDLRAGRPARRPPRAAARSRGRRAGRRPDGRHRDGHGDLRPPQRDAADAGRVGGAGGRRRAAVGHLAPPVPDEAGHPAPPVRARAGPPGDLGRPAGDLVHAAPGGPRRRPTRSPRTPRGSSTCSPSPRPPRSRCCSRSRRTA